MKQNELLKDVVDMVLDLETMSVKENSKYPLEVSSCAIWVCMYLKQLEPELRRSSTSGREPIGTDSYSIGEDD